MARRGFSSDADGEDDVNVTPLLDIVFIMLIFFIVTSTFVKEPGEEIIRPDAVTAEEDLRVNILVAVTADDEIFIDKQQVDISEVRVAVQQLIRENPRASTAVIQADEGSTSRYLVETMEQIRSAGVSNVYVSTIKT